MIAYLAVPISHHKKHMKILTRIFVFILLELLPARSVWAQLQVGTVGTPEELATKLLGTGVTITNVTLNCSNGGWGTFVGTSSNIGMDSGIVLASGDITNAVGPNMSTGITTDFGADGDQDLS